ncbi:MAG: bca [Bacteroidetes bacterium]|nr:bca [Bacteroidota bacterium]
MNKTSNNISVLFLLLLVLIGMSVQAQVQNNPPMQNVLGTSGGTKVLPSGISIDYTVGECIVTTVGPFNTKFLTQGFQQPNDANSTLNESVNSVNSTCIDAKNGSVMFQPFTSTGPVTINFNNEGFGTSTLFTNLAPGTYPYVVTDGNFTITDSVVISEDQIDCGQQLIFYKGVTPNGDGHNDTWVIDGITNFETSRVLIYNRWGDQVWKGENYDNNTVVFAGKNTNGKDLTDATYFYLVEAGGKTYKGWVEVTH